jgi:hypothetical protein
MPLIISQEELADGLHVVMSGLPLDEVIVTSADLPNQIKNGTIAECETYINNFLANKLKGYDFVAKVFVISIVPLVVKLVTATDQAQLDLVTRAKVGLE